MTRANAGSTTSRRAASPRADAELIRLCADYIAAVDTYNRHGGHLESAVDPLAQAVDASHG